MTGDQRSADLVFEGGGVKGIGLAGAYAVLEERGYTVKRVAGTSAGAITAALVAAGYSSAELDDIVLKLPFTSFEDERWTASIPLVGDEVDVLLHRGLYKGQFFMKWMAERLEAKGITRFGQLVDPDAEGPDSRYRLRVIASDVTHRKLLVLPDDAGHLGVDPDELEIAYAVRMSMSIPFFFEPVRHHNPQTRQEHLIVDGGMLSNFPVWLFDTHGAEPRWPTFGLLLVEGDPTEQIGDRLPGAEHGAPAGSLLDYVKAMAHTMMEAHDRLYVEKANYARTIPIPTLGVGTTEFDITPERVKALYDSGRHAAADFLDRWDFAAYIAEFRGDRPHSRRAEIATELRDAGVNAAGSPSPSP